MAFTYSAGLRIRPPEPMPECVEGMSPQDYFALVLAQSSLESATSAENNSGDSAPTPFNLGQIQNDISRNATDIDAVETDVSELDTRVDGIEGTFAGGLEFYSEADISAVVGLPSAGNWSVAITPIGVVLVNMVIDALSQNSFTVSFDAAPSAGSFSWVAFKRST